MQQKISTKSSQRSARSNPLITDYGQYWERTDLFEVKQLKNGSHSARLIEDYWESPLARRGIYVLYRGINPVYVGRATTGMYGIANRLYRHANGWYAFAWDNVSWYVFREGTDTKTIDVVEALLVASIPGLLNGAQPGGQLGKRHYPGNEHNLASNTLWKRTARLDDDMRTK